MIRFIWNGITYEADKAVHGIDYIIFYDDENNEVSRIFNIDKSEWQNIQILEGSWTNPIDIPTDVDHLQADIDFLMMENEFLEEDNVELQAQIEIDRADIDYCLMLLEDE